MFAVKVQMEAQNADGGRGYLHEIPILPQVLTQLRIARDTIASSHDFHVMPSMHKKSSGKPRVLGLKWYEYEGSSPSRMDLTRTIFSCRIYSTHRSSNGISVSVPTSFGLTTFAIFIPFLFHSSVLMTCPLTSFQQRPRLL